jgi:hypothetical protein
MPLSLRGDAMKKRSKADDEPTKARRRKTAPLKRRNGPKTQRRSSSIASLETKVVRLTRERDEALEQQAATSEVLRAISSTPANLQPVFEAMLAHAVRICDAMGGGICRWDGRALHHVAVRWVQPAFYGVRLDSGPWRARPWLKPSNSLRARSFRLRR